MWTVGWSHVTSAERRTDFHFKCSRHGYTEQNDQFNCQRTNGTGRREVVMIVEIATVSTVEW